MQAQNFHTKEPEASEERTGARRQVPEILSFTPPVFKKNRAGKYIEFYAFDPAAGRMRRKTIKLNHIKGLRNIRQYVNNVTIRLYKHLLSGWNPWIDHDTSNLPALSEGLDRYEVYVEKMFADGIFRKETYAGYKSYLKILRQYNRDVKPAYYMYQFDRKYCTDFLDWVFIDRNNGAQTRNNYLAFLKVLSSFLVEKGYLSSKPTDGITVISKRLYSKGREPIPSEAMRRISEYLRTHDPYFLLACQLLYYCLIRPVEMTRLLIRDFNLKESTLTIRAECSKNKKKQTVTVPKKVIFLALDLGVFSAAMDDHVFSTGLRPGPAEIDPKIFRDHWMKLRRPLNLRKEWKFYSLKDSGITALLDRKLPVNTVRDQARHSSIAITDIYTPHGATVTSPDIIDIDGPL